MKEQTDRLLHHSQLPRILDINLHNHLLLEFIMRVHPNLPLLPVEHHNLVAVLLLGRENLAGLVAVDFELLEKVELRDVGKFTLLVLIAAQINHEGVQGLLGGAVDGEVRRRREVIVILLQR